MNDHGAFNDRARLAIYEVGWGRCIGCGRTDITAQHRRARGMGGTSDVSIGHPANGLPLCGSGTTGTHGWTEHHPAAAALLGWRLDPGQPALGTPFWTYHLGWRRWIVEDDGCPVHEFVDVDDLDRLDLRQAALDAYLADLEVRKGLWAKKVGTTGLKSQR